MKHRKPTIALFAAVTICIIVIIALKTHKFGRENTPPVYPEYTASSELAGVEMRAEQISEHRLSVEITNDEPNTIYFDCSFELYTTQGERVPISHDLIADTWLMSKSQFWPYVQPGKTRRFAVTLSLLYGKLDAGSYKLVKQITNGYDGEEETNYVSALFELHEDMSNCTYPAEPYDDCIFYHEMLDIEGLTIHATTADAGGCTIYAENKNEFALYPKLMNGEFALYKLVDCEYMPVRSTMPYAYSAVGYNALEGSSNAEYRINWESRYGKLDPGTYALVTKWSDVEFKIFESVVPIEISKTR